LQNIFLAYRDYIWYNHVIIKLMGETLHVNQRESKDNYGPFDQTNLERPERSKLSSGAVNGIPRAKVYPRRSESRIRPYKTNIRVRFQSAYPFVIGAFSGYAVLILRGGEGNGQRYGSNLQANAGKASL